MRGHYQGELTIATTIEKALAKITTEGLLLPTEVGTMIVTVTSPDHIHLESPRNLPVTVRGVTYRHTLHLNLYDGVWSLTRSKDTGKEENYLLYLKKVNADGTGIYNKPDEASDSAKQKVYEAVKGKINEWAKTQAAKEILAAVAVKKATERVDGARETTKRLRAELAEAEKEVQAAEHHLTKTQESFVDVIAPKA